VKHHAGKNGGCIHSSMTQNGMAKTLEKTLL
jgi:hypothetical protein